MSRLARFALIVALAPLTLPAFAGGVKLRPAGSLYVDAQGAQLLEPEDVAFDGTSTLVVADTGNGRLVIASVGDEIVTPGPAYAIAEIASPQRVQWTPQGELLVLDGKTRRIARVSRAGVFQGWLDLQAASDARVVVRSFRVSSSGEIDVLDARELRVVRFSAEGKLLGEVRLKDTSGSFTDLTVDAGGGVYVLDSVGKRVLAAPAGSSVATPIGQSFAQDLDFPTRIALGERGNLFVSDHNGGGIVVIGTDGSFRGRQAGWGWTEGLLRYPSGLAPSGSKLLFVADRGNSRVQVFALSE